MCGEPTVRGRESRYLLVRRGLLEADDQVDDGDVDRGHTERETGELAIEAGDDLADSLGRTRRGGDDVVADSTATTPVLVGRTIDGALGGSGGVDGGHETLDDTELVVDDLGERGQAVGRARRVRDLGGAEVSRNSEDGTEGREKETYDGVLGVVRVKVNAADEHGGIGRRSGDDDLLGTTLQVGRGPKHPDNYVRYRRGKKKNICALVDGGEDTSGLDDVLSTDASPVDVGRVLLLEDGYGLALDPELAVLGLDGALEAAVDRVILEHVDHVVKGDEGAIASSITDPFRTRSKVGWRLTR